MDVEHFFVSGVLGIGRPLRSIALSESVTIECHES